MSDKRRFWGSEAASGLALISPTAIYAILLLAAPLATTLLYSVFTDGYLVVEPVFTLKNYTDAWTNEVVQSVMARSVLVSMLVTAATVILAYPVAYFISFHGGDRKGFWLFVITLPFWASYLLRIMSWKVILGYEGVLNTALQWLGLIAEPLTSLLYNVNAVILTLVHSWAAFAILPIFVSLEKVDRTLLEAAADLGDGPIRRFLRVTLPLTLPGVVSALIIVMIPTVGDYVTPKLVGGKDGVMIADTIQAQFGRASNWPLGAALAVSTMAIVTATAGLVVLGVKLLTRSLR